MLIFRLKTTEKSWNLGEIPLMGSESSLSMETGVAFLLYLEWVKNKSLGGIFHAGIQFFHLVSELKTFLP